MAQDGDTIFGKIIRKEIPAKIVYESDSILAFRDINPVAPKHILVIPKKALVNTLDATPSDDALLGELLRTAALVAKQEGIADTGFRLVINNGEAAGQTVSHLHVHLLGGRDMAWPPG